MNESGKEILRFSLSFMGFGILGGKEGSVGESK
jgi:hypothetical protein